MAKKEEIIQYIIENKHPKQAEISEKLSIDRGNLSRICSTLKNENILVNTQNLEFNANYQTYLLIQIKLKKVIYNLVNSMGQQLSQIKELYFDSQNELQNQIIFLLNDTSTNTYDAIGVIVQSKLVNNKISYLGSSNIMDFDIYNFIKTFTNKNLYIENYANISAYTHYLYEYDMPHSILYIRANNGIGAGLIYHKEIFHGYNGSALEPLDYNRDNYDPALEGILAGEDVDNEKFIAFINDIINSMSLILDPEIIIIDSNITKDNPHLIFSFDKKNIVQSVFDEDISYISMCKLILRGETNINYNKAHLKDNYNL